MRSYRPIRDYAILGDGNTAVLVSRDGSIDWCCWPNFDSGAVFCRLLDARRGGWFSVGPAGRHSAKREYAPDTNVLVTTFEGEGGSFRLTDLMPIQQQSADRRGQELAPSHRILRLIEGVSGTSRVHVEFRPTFDFARARTEIVPHTHGAVAQSDHAFLSLACPAAFEVGEDGVARADMEVAADQRFWMALAFGEDPQKAPGAAAHGDRDLKVTLKYWQDWLGQCRYEGPYSGLVHRSALALKLLIFSPTGALVAAPTTSLPEVIGGVRNWDYRYTWLRDSALILSALEILGYYDEALNFFEWLERLELHNRGHFQIMYTIHGGAELPEISLDHLEGFRGSRPVRVGNAASEHVQVDIYGEVMEAAYLCLKNLTKPMHGELWKMISHIADLAAANWRRKDRSIWEFRGEPRQFTYSKVMCWVALDRAIELAELLHATDRVNAWRCVREEIRDTVLREGWSEQAGAFTQYFGSTDLDAASLMLPIVGFLPADDPRMLATIDAIADRLTDDRGLVYRYPVGSGVDGLDEQEGAFLLCTFWLAQALALSGQVRRARETFELAIGYVNDLGLAAEEVDADTGELLGNFPQAFSHIGMINAAWAINQAESRAAQPVE
jgi:GH15 family glucan-1,4-alpha-glucosidase